MDTKIKIIDFIEHSLNFPPMPVKNKLVGVNSRCPHCCKLYRPRKEKEHQDFNYCPKGHRTLYLDTMDKKKIQQNLNQDYAAWVEHYRTHHHWIKKIFHSKKKLFVKVLRRDQRNLFILFREDIDKMIENAFLSYQENKNN